MIIFEGEELLLHYHEGKKDYILITFASADQTDQAYSRYFLKPIAEKYNISCLGITTKIDNFYQHSDMHNIIPLCNEITQHYKQVIIIGLSMGGYAALKYSAALHATIVLAMGARYTLDVAIAPVCGIMQRTVDRLDPYCIQETTIQPHEVAGKLYIAHDTYQGIPGYNDIDHKHAYQILENLPNTVLVPVVFAHHLVVNSLKGSEEFKSILDVLITENNQKLIQQVAYVRRHHIYNIDSKILLLRNRYPLLIYKLLISKSFSEVKNNNLLFDNHEKNLTLIYLLQKHGYQKESRSLLRICFLRALLKCDFYKVDQMNKKHNIHVHAQASTLPYFIVQSGYILVFDLVQKKIIAVRDFIYPTQYIPIRIYEDQAYCKVVCVWENVVFELKYHAEAIYLTPLCFDSQLKETLFVEYQNQMATIYTPDRKFCFTVEPTGESGFYKTEPKEWEQFVVV